MAISRRGLFGFLAGAPVAAVGAIAAARSIDCTGAYEIAQRLREFDPPMIEAGDFTNLNLNAGAINWVDPDYDERTGTVLRPIPMRW